MKTSEGDSGQSADPLRELFRNTRQCYPQSIARQTKERQKRQKGKRRKRQHAERKGEIDFSKAVKVVGGFEVEKKRSAT